MNRPRLPKLPDWLGRRGSRRPLLLGLAVLVAAVVGLAAVLAWPSSRGPGGAKGSTGKRSAAAKVPAVRVTVKPADRAEDVALDATVRVGVTEGRIGEVRVTTPSGDALDGKVTADGHGWASSAPLAPGTRYKVAVTATDAAGASARRVASFTTLTPSRELKASVMPLDGQSVGVGLPISVWFNHPVPDRAAIERRLKVETSSGLEGAWRWFSDSEVHFRPKRFWPSGERVTLALDLAGARAGPGTWGVADRTVHFRVGVARVSTVNVNTHTMKVAVNGKVVKVLPVSTGRDKYPTTNGVHFVIEKTQDKLMDSATVNIPRNSPDGYYEHVFWSVRISNSGEFVHAAPWSVGSQGHANVSHGCVNLSTANAQWFFKLAQPGDVVTVVGSPKQPNNWTFGVADWNIPWSKWVAGSALDRTTA
jgi:lipoprotein-anchoring transpeptidase ErfK/SrfK